MRIGDTAGEFLVIGENIHTTRVVLRAGKHVEAGPDGREAIRFADATGAARLLAIPESIRASGDFANGKVKHVAAAIVAGMGGDAAAADDGRAYLARMARRQVEAGAHWLDLNVDEVAADVGARREAMAWLVELIEGVGAVEAGGVAVALDSSSADVIRAGLAASGRTGASGASGASDASGAAGAAAGRDGRRPMLNSASLERLDVLDLAAEAGCPLVAGASSPTGMPSGIDDRVANGTAIVTAALERGIPLRDIHLDPLVLPVAVDPDAGSNLLEAIRRLRSAFGPDIHITGGFSNVSFGLPARRVLNDAFLDLAARAGADSGIVDPVASDLARVLAPDRSTRAYLLAADLLEGRDPFGGEYLTAFRAGELETPTA